MKRTFSIKSVLSRFDWILTAMVICCCAFGIFIIYSATSNTTANPMSYLKTQSVAFVLGMIGFICVAFFDYDNYRRMIKYIFAFNILMLVLVLIIGTGEDIGSKSWIRFGGFGFQPSEIVKIGFIITFAFHLSEVKSTINKPKTLFFLLLHMGGIVGLILWQPDAGTAMVFMTIFIMMMFAAGLSMKYLIAAVVALIASAPILWFGMKPYQKGRILTFLNPDRDPLYKGFQAIQSRIAVGSGELFGKGYLNGSQVQEGILPASHTDFIFSSAAEEFGFVGSIVILGLLLCIIWRCIYVAMHANDDFGSFICIGVAAMFTFHVFENIGMCIGLTPITGIPLLFFSYGGSSMITSLVTIGLVVAVGRRPKLLNDLKR